MSPCPDIGRLQSYRQYLAGRLSAVISSGNVQIYIQPKRYLTIGEALAVVDVTQPYGRPLASQPDFRVLSYVSMYVCSTLLFTQLLHCALCGPTAHRSSLNVRLTAIPPCHKIFFDFAHDFFYSLDRRRHNIILYNNL